LGDHVDDFELDFYLLVLDYLAIEGGILQEDDLRLVRELELEERRRNRRARVRREDRTLFQEEMLQWPDSRFRRYFRLSRESYQKLCTHLCVTVGENVFQPQERLHEERQQDGFRQGAIHACGGKLSGEVRVAIFLRILAGASYLDLMVIFQVVHDPIYRSFKMVCQWMLEAFKFPLVTALEDEDIEYFQSASSAFTEGGSSQGNFVGCFGSLDGVAIKIKQPTHSKSIPNPGAYFCRKGFHALNCQAICDFNKKISWFSSRHIGSCHDSVAFTDTKLYDLLSRKQKFLHDNRFFLVGDSAYNMESFLLVPYDKPPPRSSEDTYNFYHSSARIHIECAFGEIVMRFGLLWRTLRFDIAFVGQILNAACLLHNFIVDERLLNNGNGDNYASPALADDTVVAPRHMDDLPEVTDNNAPRPAGRPSDAKAESRELGRQLRESLSARLQGAALARPLQEGFRYNQHGMIYMEY
jgi:hypothetical protein